MMQAGTIFLLLLFLSVGLAAAGWFMAWRLAPETRRRPQARWLLAWSVKGLLIPFAIWVLMNLGLSWNLQPFMPQIQAAQNGGANWFPAFLRVAVAGLFVIVLIGRQQRWAGRSRR